MSLRIREDHTIVCAAKSPPQCGDVYVDDAVHYALSCELGVLHPSGVDDSGADLWVFDTTRTPDFA